jgi:hypothetical protein
VNPPGPLHDHAVAPVLFADRFTVPPTHIGPSLVVPAEDGTELTVTEVVYTVAGVHPEPVPLLRASIYVPVTVGTSDGFCKVELKPEGPLHDHPVAPVLLADRFTVPPAHIGPSLVAPDEVGAALTVTVVV